jgi:hypothetical protein
MRLGGSLLIACCLSAYPPSSLPLVRRDGPLDQRGAGSPKQFSELRGRGGRIEAGRDEAKKFRFADILVRPETFLPCMRPYPIPAPPGEDPQT